MVSPLALIIDLDDTLIDTTLSADRVWRNTAAAFANELRRPAEDIDQALLVAREWYWSCPERNQQGRLDINRARIEVVHHGFKALGVDDVALAERFALAYTAGRIDAIQPFPGALEAVADFRGLGLKLALITNGHAGMQRKKVDAFGLEALFDAVLIEGEIGYGKPDRRVYERALGMMRVTADQTWMVGDNLEWEVGVPQSLGMTGVWVDWKKTGLPADSLVQPDLIVHAVAELTGHLQGASVASLGRLL